MQQPFTKIRRTLGAARGTIDVLGAFFLVRVIRLAARAVEYRDGLSQRLENQRMAAAAASGDALVGHPTSSTSSATNAASNLIGFEELSGDGSAFVVSSPARSRNNAAEVSVTGNLPLQSQSTSR
jgi:hypothetical protein